MNVSRQRLAENITILWALNEVPAQPNEIELLQSRENGRQMTLARERQTR